MDTQHTRDRFVEIMAQVDLELAVKGPPRSSGYGSALLTNVLQRIGSADAYPLFVGVRLFNKAYQEWVRKHGRVQDESSAQGCAAAGGVSILLGKESRDTVDAGQRPGHLVVIAPGTLGDRHAMLDLTIAQVTNSERGINLQPLCLAVSDEFVTGKQFRKATVSGTLLFYDAFPNDLSYRSHDAWSGDVDLDEMTAQVVRRLKTPG